MAKKEGQQKEFNLGYKVAKINTTKFSYSDLEEDKVAFLFENEDNLKVSLDVNMGISLEKSEIFFEINTSLSNRENDESVITHIGKTTFSAASNDHGNSKNKWTDYRIRHRALADG